MAAWLRARTAVLLSGCFPRSSCRPRARVTRHAPKPPAALANPVAALHELATAPCATSSAKRHIMPATPSVQDGLKRRRQQVPQRIVELAWRAQVRLHTRYRHLCARLGPHKAIMAIAREFGRLHLGSRRCAPRGLSRGVRLRVTLPLAGRADRVAENPRVALVVPTHAQSPRSGRCTAHCHAATALLTRTYIRVITVAPT